MLFASVYAFFSAWLLTRPRISSASVPYTISAPGRFWTSRAISRHKFDDSTNLSSSTMLLAICKHAFTNSSKSSYLSGRPTGGRPAVHAEIKALITRMATANPLWGAPRIHGDLLKLGLDVSERTVSRSIPKRRSPPSQTWRTFLANHV